MGEDSIVLNIMYYSKAQPNGVLIILDDMITSEKAINKKTNSLLKTLFYQGRHYKVSLILTSQKLKDIPLGMRLNCTHLICFNLKSNKEEVGLFSENEYKDNLSQLYKLATSEKYNFLYINKGLNKAYHNFEKEL